MPRRVPVTRRGFLRYTTRLFALYNAAFCILADEDLRSGVILLDKALLW